MVEEPNFEYNYDLAYQKSFAARLSFRIMTIAATVFLVAVILFFYFTEDSMTLPLTHQIVKYGMVVFVVGLTLLFVACTIAIYQMVKPLKMFTESAVSIAEGNLDTPLPKIHSQDELLQLRNAFEYMQSSLKQHIDDLKTTTASQQRLQSELVIAHDIQMGMIPTIFPDRDDLDLFASMTPAKEVGGDLYDFIVEGDELFFIIGDVAGKGVPASLYMAVTRTLFRNLASNYQSAANIMREMNHAIASTNDSLIFVTAFIGVLDLKTHHLTYCNAAHNAPAVQTAQGDCYLLEVETNLPIGIEDHFNYEDQQVPFPENTSLLLYTDGLTEAMYIASDGSRRLFGEDRMLHDLSKNKSSSAIEVVDYLKQHVTVFADGTEQGDDLTLMFLRHGTSQKHASTAPRRIIMKNEMVEVSRMRGFFFSVCREHDIDEEMVKSLNLAIEEWVANVINYAYPKGTRGHVELTAEISDDVLTLVVKDHGIPFDPTQHEEVDVNAELNDRPIGGLGIFLVRSIMDTMEYQRTPDGYNVLTLSKKIK
ncbi:MAG: SpoIIE family protein phosphatase [Prevotella sp.]|nr:SpoIIE family protein phosphatase [Prevotella sp.]